MAEILAISKDLLYRWRKEYAAREGLAFPGHGREGLSPQEQKIKELEKKPSEAEMDRDILKKVMAIFSKAPK